MKRTRVVTAKDVMSRRIFKARPWQYAREVARLLDDRGVSGAPVVDALGRLVGVVSKSDLVHAERGGDRRPERLDFFRFPQAEGFLHGYYQGPSDRTTVRQIMTKGVVKADESTAVGDLAQLMLGRGIHRVLITRKGRLTGVVSALDLLKVLSHGK